MIQSMYDKSSFGIFQKNVIPFFLMIKSWHAIVKFAKNVLSGKLFG